MVSLTKDWFKNTRNFLASSYKNSINLPLFYNKSFDVVVNLQMNLRNWGVSGGVGFGGTGPAAILGVGLHPPPGKVKNPGGVRAKKARCSLAMESTKKLAKILTGLFSSKTTQNVEAKLNFFWISSTSFIGDNFMMRHEVPRLPKGL